MWDLLFDGVLTIALYPKFCIWLICFYSFKIVFVCHSFPLLFCFKEAAGVFSWLYVMNCLWKQNKLSYSVLSVLCRQLERSSCWAFVLLFRPQAQQTKHVSLCWLCSVTAEDLCLPTNDVSLPEIHTCTLCTVAFSDIFENVTQRWCGTSKAPSLHHRLSSSTLLAEWLKSPAMITF